MIAFHEPPRVLNLRACKPEDGIYVGRPSKFGNPFELGKDGNRSQVIEKYAEHLKQHPELIDAAQRELRGRNLICWCAPKPCHADLLLSIANSEQQ